MIAPPRPIVPGLERAAARLERLAVVSPSTMSLYRHRAEYLNRLGRDTEARTRRKLAPPLLVRAADSLRRILVRLQEGGDEEKAGQDSQ